MTSAFSSLRAPALLSLAIVAGCGGGKKDGEGSSGAAVASGAASSSAPAQEAPASPFSVVLEAREAIAFSGLEGGVWIVDAARRRHAICAEGADLEAKAMPAGLPEGPGRVLWVAGRMPRSVWLSFEKLREDGKVEATPLYRLGSGAFSKMADDWRPHLAAWSKNRILAASTSSGKLKIKVVEPSLPRPPDDLPSAHLDDASCAKTLQVKDLVAFRTGEAIAAGTCRPGSASSPSRYVMIRWPAPTSAAVAAPDAGGEDAGAGAEATAGVPGVLDVISDAPARLAHRVLHARAADDAYAAGQADDGPRLYHFNGNAWSAMDLPKTGDSIRGLAGTGDGALWMITDHAIWRRPLAGAWESVPPPDRAFAESGGSWELTGLWGLGADDVWIAARRATPAGTREVVLRRRAPKDVIRWE